MKFWVTVVISVGLLAGHRNSKVHQSSLERLMATNRTLNEGDPLANPSIIAYLLKEAMKTKNVKVRATGPPSNVYSVCWNASNMAT